MVGDTQTFLYYITLWLMDKSFSHLLSCATTAVTPTDSQWVMGVLKDELGRSGEYHDLLIRMQLILKHYVSGDDNGYKEEIEKSRELFGTADSFLIGILTGKFQLNLPEYHLIHLVSHLLEDPDITLNQLPEGHRFYGNRLETAFLAQNPGPFALAETLQNRTLRDCLNWCRAILKDTLASPIRWEIHQSNSANKRWSKFITIFTLFWMKWKTGEES
jgi:hypothetical protein